MANLPELIERCIESDQKALEEFYMLFKDRIFGICFRYAMSSEEAEDILQETFYSIFKNLKKAQKYENIFGWMRKIAISKSINSYHKNKKYRKNIVLEDEVSLVASNSFEKIETNLDTEALLALIRELPKGYQMVFNMFAIDGYSHKEISQALGISVSTSKTQLFKAKAELRSKFKLLNRIVYEKSV